MKKTFLVTGGAGYIGSHICKALHKAGHIPVAFDDLSTGARALVKWGPFAEGDVTSAADLHHALDEYRPDAVIHLAAVSTPKAAAEAPERAREVNLFGTRLLARLMRARRIKDLLFASTASVYGISGMPPFSEDADPAPSGPYAETKFAAERELAALGAGGDLNVTIFRFFNVAGSDFDGETGEFRPDDGHLVPRIIDSFLRAETLGLYGRDYDTPDGSCIRDYVHVLDIARAFLTAAERIAPHTLDGPINLGAGTGHSVLEMVDRAQQIFGGPLEITFQERRPFDPPALVSDIRKARAVLGWQPVHSSLETIIGSSFSYRRRRHLAAGSASQYEQAAAARQPETL